MLKTSIFHDLLRCKHHCQRMLHDSRPTSGPRLICGELVRDGVLLWTRTQAKFDGNGSAHYPMLIRRRMISIRLGRTVMADNGKRVTADISDDVTGSFSWHQWAKLLKSSVSYLRVLNPNQTSLRRGRMCSLQTAAELYGRHLQQRMHEEGSLNELFGHPSLSLMQVFYGKVFYRPERTSDPCRHRAIPPAIWPAVFGL